MRAILSSLMNSVRCLAAGTSGAFLLLVTLFIGSSTANAQKNIVVSGTAIQLGALTSGGWDGSQEPVGGTFVVGANGDVLIGDGYTGNFLQITPSGADTVLASGLGGSAATLDTFGNLYFGGNYNANVYKVPYNAATGQYVGWTTAPTTNCLGGNQDVAPCIFAPAVSAYLNTLGGQGFAGVVFDGQGNFFFETNTIPTTNPNTILECNLACIASPTATPAPIYADKIPVGALAMDPWGNIFFVDGNNSTGKVTNLNEIKLSSGSYAASPTVVVSYTNAAGFGNGISGLAISGTGTLFISNNADGSFAIPNTQSGGPNTAAMYMVTKTNGKGLALDSKGNLYLVPYNGGDVVSMVPVGSLSLGAEPLGTAATAVNATIFDTAASCTTPPTLALSLTESGLSTPEFTAAAGATCSTAFSGTNGVFSSGSLTASGGSSFSVTGNFTPTSVGERNALLTIKDSANSGSGTSALSGVGQGALANLDPGVWTSYSTGFTKPYSVSVDGAGDMAVADSGGGVFWIPAGSASGTKPTLITASSTIGEPAASAFDAAGNLYIADFKNNEIIEFSAPVTSSSASSTVVSGTATFEGMALSSPSGLAFGPDGTLYISDLANSRVVSWNPNTGENAVWITGLSFPWGIAVDSSNNLYVANTGGGNLVEDSGGIVTEAAITGVTAPWGVAVDPSGSLVVSDQASGNMVWVPKVSGVLDYTGGIVIEKNPSSALEIALDSMGNLYTPDSVGAAVYAINRSAAAIDFGTVQNGISSSTEDIYVQVTGNQPVTLGTPAFAAPSNTDFTLASTGANNKCTDGSSGNPGQYCILQSVFTPAVGTAAGTVTGTSALSSNASNASSAAIMLSGTATESSILPQVITGFTPTSPIQAGQQIALTATGGASGSPVIFSIDPSSGCLACATISGSTLTAVSAGAIKVDANQAAGTANGNQYAAAKQVQAAITINNNLVPADVPALLMTQQNWLAALPAGGAFAQDSQAGTSMGVNQQGNVLVSTAYGGTVALYNVQAGAWTTLGKYGKYGNAGGVAVDSAGNLYMGALYSNIIAKVPYNNGAYSAITDASTGTPPANCTGSDTSECVVAPVAATSGIGGVSAMTFDSAGDLFIGTDDQGSKPWSIWECTAACLSTGAPVPVMLFQEPAGNNASASVGQYYTGGLAVDPWGNLFFTDSLLLNQSNNASKSTSSDLYYLPTSAGAGFGGATTGYAAAPTLLQTFTNAKPAGYDDELDAVAATSDGTVYYSIDQSDGIYAIPNTQAGGPTIADQYVVSSQGAETMTLDSHGSIFYIAYSNALGGHSIGDLLTTNNLVTPIAQLDGPSVTASATVVDNAFTCSKTATLEFASSNAEFSATAGATCTALAFPTADGTLSNPVSTVSSYPATITFTATDPGSQTATFTASDTTNGGEGTAMVTGFANATPQTIAFTAPTTTTYTYAPGMTITVSVSNGGSNNAAVFTVDASSSGTGTFSAATVTGTTSSATLTVTQAGSIVIDANEVGGLVNGVFYDAATQAQLTLTVNPASQTVVFPQPTSPVTYSPTLTVSLSANGGASGNPVTFSVDSSSTGAGTVSASTLSGGTSTATLTVSQAGNIVIDADQAANSDYAAAPQVQQTVVVNEASQTISFVALTQPFHYIATGVTLRIQAAGGGSNQAIVFTVDKSSTMAGAFSTSTVSGATSTTTLTMPASQSPTSGTIVVDATQPGNTNYAAATVTQYIVNVLAPLPVQIITFSIPQTQAGATTLTLAATASSGFPVIYTSSTTSVCTVSGSTVTFLAVTSASTCTITAAQPGDNQYFAAATPVTVSFTVNPSGQAPTMSLNLSLTTLTIEPGTVGTTQITLGSQNNFTGMVTFSCGNLPTGYSCAFNPNPINLPKDGSTTTTLTVTPPASNTAAAVRGNFKPLFPATLAIALCFMGFRKRSRLHLLLILVAFFAGVGLVSGCGGSSSSATSKPVTTQVTITATSGLTSTSSTLTVIVE